MGDKGNQKENTNLSNNGQNLNELKNLEDMNKELNSLKYQYVSEKSNTVEKMKLINDELNEKSGELKLLTKDNFKLI
jgi:hypothetical protein